MNNCFKFFPTPVTKYERLSRENKINVYVKRDDLFPQLGGGNKSRKLQYILYKANSMGCNAVVTTGGSQSNHVRATALMCAYLGWKTIMIIHDNEPKGTYRGNLKLIKLAGSEIRFVNKSDVKWAMDQAIQVLEKDGHKPYYIWGGGHCVEGAYAYYDAVLELKNQLCELPPDFIVVASGTGTTQAGIEIGIRQFYPNCKVLGVSVAREASKGKEAIIQSMLELNEYLGEPVTVPNDIFFDDKMMGSGYEATWPELFVTINWAAKNEGLVLDPTYTGKAFFALQEYVKNGIINKGSNVLFWHTGGLLNLMACEDI